MDQLILLVYKNRMSKVFYIFVLLILFNCKNLYSSNVYIELKIENEIITNFDIEKEKKYLLALNNNLSQIPEKELYELSKNSIINEKIKKKELLIYFDLEKAEMIMKDVIKNFYIKVGFENETQFSNYLEQYQISIDYVKENTDSKSGFHIQGGLQFKLLMLDSFLFYRHVIAEDVIPGAKGFGSLNLRLGMGF